MLSRPDILRAISQKKLRFSPEIDPSSVKQVSIDLRLGRHFTTFKTTPAHIEAVKLAESIWQSDDIWASEEADEFTLRPGKMVLAQTLETVSLPNYLVGLVEGRSSYGRLGIGVHVTAPKIDPGFQGTITLEMVNHGNLPLKLIAGENKPAQLMLFKISSALKKGELYGSASDDAFQNQQEPTPKRKKLRMVAIGEVRRK